MADLMLRAAGGPLAVRVRWPPRPIPARRRRCSSCSAMRSRRTGRAPDDDRLAHALCARLGAVVLCVPWATRDAGGRRSALGARRGGPATGRRTTPTSWTPTPNAWCSAGAAPGPPPPPPSPGERASGAGRASAGRCCWSTSAAALRAVRLSRRPRPSAARHARPAPATLVGLGRGECAARTALGRDRGRGAGRRRGAVGRRPRRRRPRRARPRAAGRTRRHRGRMGGVTGGDEPPCWRRRARATRRRSAACRPAAGRAAPPLRPHAALGRRCRGRDPGDDAARLARAAALRGPGPAGRLAAQDRHQRLPERDRPRRSGSCRSRPSR